MTEKQIQATIQGRKQLIKRLDAILPYYCGEVQEIKIKGRVIVARRSGYEASNDSVVWGSWEEY